MPSDNFKLRLLEQGFNVAEARNVDVRQAAEILADMVNNQSSSYERRVRQQEMPVFDYLLFEGNVSVDLGSPIGSGVLHQDRIAVSEGPSSGIRIGEPFEEGAYLTIAQGVKLRVKNVVPDRDIILFDVRTADKTVGEFYIGRFPALREPLEITHYQPCNMQTRDRLFWDWVRKGLGVRWTETESPRWVWGEKRPVDLSRQGTAHTQRPDITLPWYKLTSRKTGVKLAVGTVFAPDVPTVRAYSVITEPLDGRTIEYEHCLDISRIKGPTGRDFVTKHMPIAENEGWWVGQGLPVRENAREVLFMPGESGCGHDVRNYLLSVLDND